LDGASNNGFRDYSLAEEGAVKIGIESTHPLRSKGWGTRSMVSEGKTKERMGHLPAK